jgi:hypothetical protein
MVALDCQETENSVQCAAVRAGGSRSKPQQACLAISLYTIVKSHERKSRFCITFKFSRFLLMRQDSRPHWNVQLGMSTKSSLVVCWFEYDLGAHCHGILDSSYWSMCCWHEKCSTIRQHYYSGSTGKRMRRSSLIYMYARTASLATISEWRNHFYNMRCPDQLASNVSFQILCTHLQIS